MKIEEGAGRTRARGIGAMAAAGALIALAAVWPSFRAALVFLEPRAGGALFLAGLGWGAALWVARARGPAASRRRRRIEIRALRHLEAGWVLCVLLFLLPLWAAWTLRPPGGVSAFSALFGRIPWSDAHGHFEGATRLLAEGEFSHFSGRRPLNACWLSVRLVLGGGRLEGALAIQAAVLGLAVGLAARAVGLRFGLAPALAFVGLTFGLTRGYVPTAATEPLGVTLACLALAILVSRGARRRWGLLVFGLLLVELSLQARPGAQFLLPCLALWGVWVSHRGRMRVAVAAAAVIAAGALITSTLNRLYGSPDSSFVSYPAYTLYGLATGSNYKQARDDFGAEMERVSDDRERARFLYRRSWERIRDDPGLLLATLARNEGKFFVKLLPNLAPLVSPMPLLAPPMSRVRATPDAAAVDKWTGAPVLAAAFLAFLAFWWRSRRDERAFWLAAGTGLMASAPFVYGDAGLRGLAAAYPLLALALSAGLTPRRALWSTPAAERNTRQNAAIGGAVAALILLSALLGPSLARRGVERPAAAILDHATADEVLVAAVKDAPAVVVWGQAPADLPAPAINRRQFQRHLELSHVPPETGLDSLKPPFALLSVYDFVTRGQRILAAPPDVLRERAPFLKLVVRRLGADRNVLQAVAWEPAEP
jgi:hypothetical protein